MADLPQIRAGFWSSADGHLSGAFESSQRVDAGRTGQLRSAEIQSSYRKETLVADDSCNLNENSFAIDPNIPIVRFNFHIINKSINYRHQSVERVQSSRSCTSLWTRRNSCLCRTGRCGHWNCCRPKNTGPLRSCRSTRNK